MRTLNVHSCIYPLVIRDILAGIAIGWLGMFLLEIPANLQNWWMWGLAVYVCVPLGLICPIFTIAIILVALSDFGLSVKVHHLGLHWSRFGTQTFLDWCQISSISNNGNHCHHGGSNSRYFFGYCIRLRDGRKFRFGPYLEEAEDLGIRIEEETTQCLLIAAQRT
jgi:hypothetical protein